MVQTLGINANNDIFLGPNGNIVVLSELEAIVSACKTACQGQLGEMVLQQGLGLPNFQTIWIGTPDYAIWQSYLQNTLLGVEGVTQVDSITISAKNNILSYVAVIETIFGITTVNSSITNG